MKLSDFNYSLPDSLIASYPTAERTASRLMVLSKTTGAISHQRFPDLLQQVNAGDLIIFNNTKVIPARLLGQKTTGGKVEVLVERILDDTHALCHVRSNKPLKPGAKMRLEQAFEVEMVARCDGLFKLKFASSNTVLRWLELHGHVPLPPYIQRPDESSDKHRYQTVFADPEKLGAVAAPTAGLHFDDDLLAQLRARGVHIEFVTLHVGAGTFQPVRVEDVTQHKMHAEYAEVSAAVVQAITATKDKGGKVIAVGTTSVRSLESAAQASVGKGKPLAAFAGETDIFIYPGYEFLLVDAILTNFHLPESTLIMLVSAFAGKQHTLNAYRQAVAEKYRFFSYGDAMFIGSS